ncbi:MAG: molybdenum cofactor guanylyltransferase [Cyclobacteriaceae bacterium]
MNSDKINGLILAGGRSSRMGFNKAALQFHGKPQPEYLAEIMMPHCNEVFISCREVISESTLPILTDYFKFEGPLNGILTAFRHQSCAWLTVPVDMPNIDADLIKFLIAKRNREKMATCFSDSSGSKPEPLFTLWEPGTSEKLFGYYAEGGRSPREFLMRSPVQYLTAPKPDYLLNINTPEDLAEFKKTLQQHKSHR